MKKTTDIISSRREFCTKAVAACSAMCLAGGNVFALKKGEKKKEMLKAKHPFDRDMKFKPDRPFTYRQFYNNRYKEFIGLAKTMQHELGKEKTIAFIKNQTEKKWLKTGEIQAKRSGNQSLESYVKSFRGGFQNTLIKKVVEDTKTVFELKVSKCIWASTFLDAKAGDIGFAHICYGDYFWASSFSPKLKMVRDKTLMQGHDYCNHRYIWTV